MQATALDKVYYSTCSEPSLVKPGMDQRPHPILGPVLFSISQCIVGEMKLTAIVHSKRGNCASSPKLLVLAILYADRRLALLEGLRREVGRAETERAETDRAEARRRMGDP